MGVEKLDFQRFTQPLPIGGLLRKRELNLERASHLEYVEVGYALGHLEAWRLGRPLHPARQQEDNANCHSPRNYQDDWAEPRKYLPEPVN